MKPVIEAQHLTFAYHRCQDVLRDINLMVEPGSFYGLLGRNGAGKTTLLKILAGALEPRHGTSRTLGADSLHLGVEEWRTIGFVSEAQPLYNWLTGAELLSFTSQLYPNWDTVFCDHLCRTLDLPLDRKVGHYSKGERMKFILLLAMAFHPRLLLLDEPFSGLDVVAKEQLILCLLEVTGQERWSVVCSSHDIPEIERLADTVGIIDGGRLQVSEPLESLHRRFRRVQIFGMSEVDSSLFGNTIRQPHASVDGFNFIETAYSPGWETTWRERFGEHLEISPMPLREILLSLFTFTGAAS